MRYTPPFTPLQRREAIRAYAAFRSHLYLCRRSHPPRNAGQRTLLRAYEDAVAKFGAELLRENARVRVDHLNRHEAAARWAAVEYWQVHYGEDVQ